MKIYARISALIVSGLIQNFFFLKNRNKKTPVYKVYQLGFVGYLLLKLLSLL